MDGKGLAQATSPAGSGGEMRARASGLPYSALIIRKIIVLLNRKCTSRNKNKNYSKTRIVDLFCRGGENLFSTLLGYPTRALQIRLTKDRLTRKKQNKTEVY